jgi:hypothetical protein
LVAIRLHLPCYSTTSPFFAVMPLHGGVLDTLLLFPFLRESTQLMPLIVVVHNTFLRLYTEWHEYPNYNIVILGVIAKSPSYFYAYVAALFSDAATVDTLLSHVLPSPSNSCFPVTNSHFYFLCLKRRSVWTVWRPFVNASFKGFLSGSLRTCLRRTFYVYDLSMDLSMLNYNSGKNICGPTRLFSKVFSSNFPVL